MAEIQDKVDFWPIRKVTTTDGFPLHGIFVSSLGAQRTLIHTHGTGGNFFWNDFYPNIANACHSSGVSFLAVNSRGSGIVELEKGSPGAGISLEIFEDCLKDIDAWIEFAISQGSKSVVLEGHSFGIGKVTYYMTKGKYRELVEKVIFLGTNGVYQTQQHYLNKLGIPPEQYLEEAKGFLSKGEGTALLRDPFALAGYYPASARTYINFFTPGSELFRSTQMARETEGGYRQTIKVPLLWILGDQLEKEYLFAPFKEAFALVRAENPQVEIHQLPCDHGLHGQENETASIIEGFIKRN